MHTFHDSCHCTRALVKGWCSRFPFKGALAGLSKWEAYHKCEHAICYLVMLMQDLSALQRQAKSAVFVSAAWAVSCCLLAAIVRALAISSKFSTPTRAFRSNASKARPCWMQQNSRWSLSKKNDSPRLKQTMPLQAQLYYAVTSVQRATSFGVWFTQPTALRSFRCFS